MADVMRILSQIQQGDPKAAEELLPLVYDELRTLAAAKMAHERPGQTLQATGMVHEAYVRLVHRETDQQWNSRGHFFGAAAEAMCRILVERARAKLRKKHGGGLNRFDLNEALLADDSSPEIVVAINDALDCIADTATLAILNARQEDSISGQAESESRASRISY